MSARPTHLTRADVRRDLLLELFARCDEPVTLNALVDRHQWLRRWGPALDVAARELVREGRVRQAVGHYSVELAPLPGNEVRLVDARAGNGSSG